MTRIASNVFRYVLQFWKNDYVIGLNNSEVGKITKTIIGFS